MAESPISTNIRGEIRKVWGDSVESSIWRETERICEEKMEWGNIDSPMCQHIYQQLLMKMIVAKRQNGKIDDVSIAESLHSDLRPELWKAIIDK